MALTNPSEGQTLLASVAATIAAQIALAGAKDRLFDGEAPQEAVIAHELKVIAAVSVRLAALIEDEVVKVLPV